MGRILRIEIIALAALAPILPVGGRDLQDGHARLLKEAQEASAVAAGRFHTDALEFAERSHPGQHLPVALPGAGERAGADHAILAIDDGCDVQILVRIDAADDDASGCSFVLLMRALLARPNGFAKTSCADRTVT
jgi:hypothetical protein